MELFWNKSGGGVITDQSINMDVVFVLEQYVILARA